MSALDSPRFHPVPRSSPMVNKRKDMEQSHIQLLLQRSTGYSVMYAGYDTSPNQTWRRRDFVWVFPSGVLKLEMYEVRVCVCVKAETYFSCE